MIAELRETQKKYCSRALSFAIIISLILILFGFKSFAKGLILGTFFSIFNFILIGETLPLKLGISKKKTFLMSLGSIYLRYFILAIPIIIAIKFDQFNLITTMIGIFLVQIFLLLDHIFKYIATDRQK